MSLPPRNSAHLRLRRDEPSHRDEGRQLMHAVLDGEIDEQSPRLQELLNLDPVLRAEFDELRRLETVFAAPLTTPDISERVLARLQAEQQRPVRRIGPFFGGLAAAVAIGSAALWVVFGGSVGSGGVPLAAPTLATVPAIPAGAPSLSSEERLVEDARQAIAQTTGRAFVARDMWQLTASPMESGGASLPTASQASRVQPAAAQTLTAGNDVAITRAGLAFVNPGPVRTPVAKLANDPMLGRTATGADWQPTATRRRESVRFMVSGWYDNDGNYVPVGNSKR